MAWELTKQNTATRLNAPSPTETRSFDMGGTLVPYVGLCRVPFHKDPTMESLLPYAR